MNEIAKFVASDHDVVAIIESSDMQEEFREKTIRNIIIDLDLAEYRRMGDCSDNVTPLRHCDSGSTCDGCGDATSNQFSFLSDLAISIDDLLHCKFAACNCKPLTSCGLRHCAIRVFC